jgi:hypothetical protein
LAAVATAAAVDAGFVWVTADVIGGIVSSLLPLLPLLPLLLLLLLRVLFLLPGLTDRAADCSAAGETTERVGEIRLSRREEDFDETIVAAVGAAQRLTRAVGAARRLRRALRATSTVLAAFPLALLVLVFLVRVGHGQQCDRAKHPRDPAQQTAAGGARDQ